MSSVRSKPIGGSRSNASTTTTRRSSTSLISELRWKLWIHTQSPYLPGPNHPRTLTGDCGTHPGIHLEKAPRGQTPQVLRLYGHNPVCTASLAILPEALASRGPPLRDNYSPWPFKPGRLCRFRWGSNRISNLRLCFLRVWTWFPGRWPSFHYFQGLF